VKAPLRKVPAKTAIAPKRAPPLRRDLRKIAKPFAGTSRRGFVENEDHPIMASSIGRCFVALLSITSAALVGAIAVVACGDDDPLPATTPGDGATIEGSAPIEGGGGGGDASGGSEDAGDPTNITWQRLPDLPIDGGRHVGSESNVAVDNEDHVVVSFGESAYGFAAPHSLSVYRFDGAAWSMLGGGPVAAPDNAFATQPIVAISKAGVVFVAYGRSGGHVSRFENNAWTALPAPPANVSAMAIDNEGKPVAIAGSQLTRFDGAMWSPLGRPNAETDLYDLAVREDGSILVLGHESTTKTLRTFAYAAGAFTPSTPSFGKENPLFPDLGMNAKGFAVATWAEDGPGTTTGNVFAGILGAGAATPAIVSPPLAMAGNDARYAVGAVDPANRAYVAWREPMNGLSMSVVSLGTGGAANVTPMPKPPSELGTLPSITLDKRNLPVLSWEAPIGPSTGSFIGVARAVPK
jgi:hypothetical protein